MSMVSVTLIIALVNILFGLLILIFPPFLRIIVGVYFLLSGLLMLVFGIL